MNQNTRGSFVPRISASAREGRQETVAYIQRALRDPEVAAIISKQIEPRGDLKTDVSDEEALVRDLAKIVAVNSNRAIANRTVLEILPDIEKCINIVKSAILSPDDLLTNTISYVAGLNYLPQDTNGALIELIKKRYSKGYKIEEKVSQWIDNALFMKGSSPVLVLPENVIDYAVNRGSPLIALQSIQQDVSNGENRFRYLGSPYAESEPIIDNKGTISFQSVYSRVSNRPSEKDVTGLTFIDPTDGARKAIDNSFVSVHDNQDIFSIPRLMEKIRKTNVSGQLQGMTLQSLYRERDLLNDKEALLKNMITKDNQYVRNPVDHLHSQADLPRYAISRPLMLDVPPECVLPVTSSADPENHLGYYLLLDGDGNFLTENMVSPFNQNSSSATCDQAGMYGQYNSSLYSMLRSQVEKKGDTPAPDLTKRIQNRWATIMENDLTRRYLNGSGGSGVKLGNNQDFYRIALMRAWSLQYTQAVFVPAEQLAYFAYEYDEYGIGVSLLTKSQTIAAWRSALTVLGMIGMARAVIPAETIRIFADPADRDTPATLAMYRELYQNTKANYVPPTQLHDISSLGQWINGLSTTFDLVTDSPTAVNERVEKEETQRPRVEIDEKFSDDLKRRHYATFFLIPEKVDSSSEAEFARSLIGEDKLFAKRNAELQYITSRHLTTLIHKGTFADGKLLRDIRMLVEKNIDEIWGNIFSALVEDVDDEYGELSPYIHAHKNLTKEARRARTDANKAPQDPETRAKIIDIIVIQYINSIEIALANTDHMAFADQTKRIDEYVEYAKKYVADVLLPEGTYSTELAEKIGLPLEEARQFIVNVMVREYVSRHNIGEDFNAFLKQTPDGAEYFDFTEEHEGHTMKILTGLAKVLKVRKGIDEGVIKGMANTDLLPQTKGEGMGGGDSSEGDGGWSIDPL